MDIRRKDDKRTEGNQTPSEDGAQRAPETSGGMFGTVLVVLGLAALVALGLYLADGYGGATTSFDGPVAVVNGEEISGDQLSSQLEAFRNSTSTQAEQFNDLSETRQQEILLEGIINTELQLQSAEASGVSVSDDEIDSQLQSRIDQIGEDVFEQRLQDNDVTRDEVREDLRNQMIIDAHIQQQAGGEITASDQEVQELYQQYTAQAQQANGTSSNSVPELADLRPQIESAVIQQKRQQIASQILQDARSDAEIEVLIDGVSYPASTSSTPAASPAESETPTTETGTSSDVVPTE